MKHILLENAFIYDVPQVNEDESSHVYIPTKGYWTNSNDMPSVKCNDFKPAESKKCDIETGEDKKGE